MRQLVYQVCYARYQVSLYLWWFRPELNYLKMSKYYDQDCSTPAASKMKPFVTKFNSCVYIYRHTYVIFFIWWLVALRPSLTNPILITAFFNSYNPKVTRNLVMRSGLKAQLSAYGVLPIWLQSSQYDLESSQYDCNATTHKAILLLY